MSTFTVLKDVGAAICQLLTEGFQEQSATVGTVKAVGDAPSSALAGGNGSQASWWLYQVSEDEFTRNPPLQPTRGADRARNGQLGPLGLNLYYLLTPYGGSNDNDLVILGRAMQVLNDNAVLLVRNADTVEELRISLLPWELEDRARLWEALGQTYRLSATYQVRVARIDSERVVGVSRVIEARSGVANPPAPPPPE
jgi:hypothetical protein